MPRKRQQQRSFLSRLGALIFGTAREPQPTRRSLRVESLEHRQLMAADVGNISGVMYRDANNSNSCDSGDVGIAGLQVQLYRDTGNGTFGTNDTLVTSTTTDASGNYEFKDLVFGNYFVRRPAQTATSGVYAGKKFAQSVSAAVTPTSLKTVIDDFTTPTVQTAAVDTTNDNVPGTSVASNIAAAKTCPIWPNG